MPKYEYLCPKCNLAWAELAASPQAIYCPWCTDTVEPVERPPEDASVAIADVPAAPETPPGYRQLDPIEWRTSRGLVVRVRPDPHGVVIDVDGFREVLVIEDGGVREDGMVFPTLSVHNGEDDALPVFDGVDVLRLSPDCRELCHHCLLENPPRKRTGVPGAILRSDSEYGVVACNWCAEFRDDLSAALYVFAQNPACLLPPSRQVLAAISQQRAQAAATTSDVVTATTDGGYWPVFAEIS